MDQLVEQDDERRALEVEIADGLSGLSLSENRPDEVSVSSAGFLPSDVCFNDGSWLIRIAEVQDWLRLGGYVNPRDEPPQMAGDLFRGLGFDRGPFEQTSTGIVVADRGLERLRERVEQAIQYRDRFIEALEDEQTIESASHVWVEAWEALADAETSGPVEATATTWPIQNFADRARRGKLNLSPSYQRGDVWPTKDAQLLIESVLRGIPLPSVIILKPQDVNRPFEVVDGKQRLTAILRFIGSHPKAIAHVKAIAEERNRSDLEELFLNDYSRFRTAWKNATGEQLTAVLEKELYFPFRLRKNDDSTLTGPELAPLTGKYYHQIKDSNVSVGGERVEVRDIFESITKYQIPLIEYTNATPRQIHEVFNLYNRQGKHLNAEEIRNAVYHSIELTRVIAFAAGDADDVAAVPSVATMEHTLRQVGEDLEAFGFGTSRYRRTKVLSWLMSLLFVDSSLPDGKARLRSTAQQTNELLDRVERTQRDPFRSSETIRGAMVLVATAIAAHSTADAWAPKFKDNASGTKWQELQLVASLLGVGLATAVLGNSVEDRLIEKEDELSELSRGPHWKRPQKTQTGTQWKYIAGVALDVIDTLGVDRSAVADALNRDFGASSVSTLEFAAAVPY